MKLIGWQNGRCGVVWRGVAIERGRDRGLGGTAETTNGRPEDPRVIF